jgi:hypothetical protein
MVIYEGSQPLNTKHVYLNTFCYKFAISTADIMQCEIKHEGYDCESEREMQLLL